MARTEPAPAVDDLNALLPPDDLDVAQLEAWASAVVGAVDDLDEAIDWLRLAESPAATRLLGALAVIAENPWASRAADGSVADGADPGLLGSARPVEARLITEGAASVVATRWRHLDGTEHTFLVEIGSDAIWSLRIASGDLFEALDHEPELVDQAPIELEHAGRLLADAARRPVTADEESWANAALAQRRLATLGIRDRLEVVAPSTSHPGVEPDAESAAYAADLLRRALDVATTDPADAETVHGVAALVRPLQIEGVDADIARAVTHLEWADWLGAVIGLVRAGSGASVDGEALVTLVNRCPEVTTSIPRGERAAVASCFDAATDEWEALGVSQGGTLTVRGVRVLPLAMLAAAERERSPVATSEESSWP